MELLGREAVDRECRRLPNPDIADVGFVDAGVQPHPAQVAGDREQPRRARDDLPHDRRVIENDAGDRGPDRRVIDLELGIAHRRLVGGHAGDGVL